jgi:hypothetical protein
MKYGRNETRSANSAPVEAKPEERRASFRYPVGQVPALLGWWGSDETDVPEPSYDEAVEAESEPTQDVCTQAKTTGTTVYSAIMARGPAFARVGLLTRGNTKAATPVREAAKAAPVRERKETRHAVPASADTMSLRSCNAQILDLSQSGMSLLSEARPIEGQPVWVRLQEPNTTEWVEAQLRGVTVKEHGKFLVRLMFREACPYDFFKTAVYMKPSS